MMVAIEGAVFLSQIANYQLLSQLPHRGGYPTGRA